MRFALLTALILHVSFGLFAQVTKQPPGLVQFSGVVVTDSLMPVPFTNILVKNTYRVLLTRARYLTVIWVPRGDRGWARERGQAVQTPSCAPVGQPDPATRHSDHGFWSRRGPVAGRGGHAVWR